MRESARIMTSVALPALILAAVLPLCGCGPQASWSEALDQTAPPDPEQSEITSPRRVNTRQPTATPQSAQSEQTAREREPVREQATSGSERRDSELLMVLQGDQTCFSGAVRCYVDGSFVGKADENGRMRVPIASGPHFIEIWDSRGRWQAEITAIAGQTATVSIRCEDRGGEGLY